MLGLIFFIGLISFIIDYICTSFVQVVFLLCIFWSIFEKLGILKEWIWFRYRSRQILKVPVTVLPTVRINWWLLWHGLSTGFSNSICSKQNLIPLKWMELKVHIPSCLGQTGEWSSLKSPSVFSCVISVYYSCEAGDLLSALNTVWRVVCRTSCTLSTACKRGGKMKTIKFLQLKMKKTFKTKCWELNITNERI